MPDDYPAGFPLPRGIFSGGSALSTNTTNGDLETLLNALCEWVGIRGIVAAPVDLVAITLPQDGWCVIVPKAV